MMWKAESGEGKTKVLYLYNTNTTGWRFKCWSSAYNINLSCSASFSKAFAIAYEKHTINVTQNLRLECKMHQSSEEMRI